MPAPSCPQGYCLTNQIHKNHTGLGRGTSLLPGPVGRAGEALTPLLEESPSRSARRVFFMSFGTMSGVEPRARCVLGELSTTELHPHSCLFLNFEMECHQGARAGLKLVSLLAQPPECWGYRRAPSAWLHPRILGLPRKFLLWESFLFITFHWLRLRSRCACFQKGKKTYSITKQENLKDNVKVREVIETDNYKTDYYILL